LIIPLKKENLNEIIPALRYKQKIRVNLSGQRVDLDPEKNGCHRLPEIISIFCSIVRVMNQEDKTIAIVDHSRDFGAMGELLRALQKEELEKTESSPMEIPETKITQNIAEIMTEIHKILKEIAETQKSILEEIKKGK
jgi:hypothetical protein